MTPTKARPRTVHTQVDAELLQRSAMDEVSLRRLRRAFWQEWNGMSGQQKRDLQAGGGPPRFALLDRVMCRTWTGQVWATWLKYIDHTERDLEEMGRGEYPIAPFIVRVYSATFGIKVDWLLLGTAPQVDRTGANIDVWPLTGTR